MGNKTNTHSIYSHWKLGKLICLYDSNNITIDGETNISFTEDVRKRFEACGWHTSGVGEGNSDLDSISKAIDEAKAVTDKPSLIEIKTTIGTFYRTTLQFSPQF